MSDVTTSTLDAGDLKAVAEGGLINEDVMQNIWDISRIPLPFTDMISSDSVSNDYTEWTQDELAPPDIDNNQVDGEDATGDDTKTGARVGNHCSISTKQVKVSTRARASDTIGRSDELSYQVMNRQRELHRDVEAAMLTQRASVKSAPNTDVAGVAAGLGAWLETSTSRGAGGADGGFGTTTGDIVDAATAGTTRPMTETMVRDIVESIYQEGGDPTIFMTIPKLKRRFSEYLFTSSARVGTIMSDQGKSREAAAALGTVSVFVTDFGTLDLVANRLMPITNSTPGSESTEAYIISPSYIRQGILSGYRTEPLAKTGLSDKRQMSVDWTLKVLTEKAHGIIADIDYTAPVEA